MRQRSPSDQLSRGDLYGVTYMMAPMRYRFWLAVSFILAATNIRSASAQQRPLPIEAVESAGAGNVTLQASADYTRDARFTLSGLEGNLWRLALVRIDVGLSSIADFEISGGLRDHLQILVHDACRTVRPTATHQSLIDGRIR